MNSNEQIPLSVPNLSLDILQNIREERYHVKAEHRAFILH